MDGYIGAAFALATGALFVLLGLPLARRRIAPNRWYGYRIRQTLADEQAWYAVYAQTGRHMAFTGALLLFCGLVGLGALNDPRQQQMLVAVSLVIIVLGLGYSVVAGYLTAREMGQG